MNQWHRYVCAIALAALTGCATVAPVPVDHSAYCPMRVAPLDPGAPVQTSTDGSAAGTALAAVGASALSLLSPYAALTPFFVAKMIECGVARDRYPQAEQEIEAALRAAHRENLARGVEWALDARWPGCHAPATDKDRTAAAIVLHVDQIDYAVAACPIDMAWVIVVHWHFEGGTGPAARGEHTTRLAHCSELEPPAWLADPERARREVEVSLFNTGVALIGELDGAPPAQTCTLVYIPPAGAPVSPSLWPADFPGMRH